MAPEAIADLFAALGPVRCRRMFGGQGVYLNGTMFALEAGRELYLKADDASRPTFEQAGSEPFTYEAKGRRTVMSYWRLPAEALDDPDEAARFGRLALEAAARGGMAVKRRRRTPAPRPRR
jgi:DNA transformation protein and related proteins